MRRILVLVVVLAGLIATSAQGADVRGPRCAFKHLVPPKIVNAGPVAYLWGEAVNKCLDPAFEMGTYACLIERDWPEGPERVVECHANIDRPVLLAPHETDVFLTSRCEYTTIPRFYYVSAYVWAISIEQERFKSPKMTSGEFSTAGTSKGTKRFCDIKARDVNWRDRPW